MTMTLRTPTLPPTKRLTLTRVKGWRMKLSTAVEHWIDDIKLTKSPMTVAGYQSDLHQLVALASTNTVLAFTPDLAKLYFHTRSAQGMAMATLHRKMAALRMFGRWGVKERLWLSNPMDHLAQIKRPKHLPRPFSEDETKRLLLLALPPKERVLRALLLFTGLRVTPICMLKIGDVSYDPPTLRAWVKGAKVQVIQMHPDLKELINSYILAHTDLKGQNPLLAQSDGTRYRRRTLERMTARWGRAANVPNCLPHRWRHTFATGLLRSNVDIRVIKEAMGHEDIGSTVVYTQVTSANVADAIGKLPWTM